MTCSWIASSLVLPSLLSISDSISKNGDVHPITVNGFIEGAQTETWLK